MLIFCFISVIISLRNELKNIENLVETKKNELKAKTGNDQIITSTQVGFFVPSRLFLFSDIHCFQLDYLLH